MDTTGKTVLKRVWAKMSRQHQRPEPERQYIPPPPIETPPSKRPAIYTVGGKASDQKVRSRYRNPVIKQALSNDPRFNHALRR